MDVEPDSKPDVESQPLDTQSELEGLFRSKVLFVTGKGGVGKSLLCALLARIAVSQFGKKVTIVQPAGHQGVDSYLSPDPIRSERGSNLDVSESIQLLNVDLASNLKAFLDTHLPMSGLYSKLMDHKLSKAFFGAFPGLDEICLLGRLAHFATGAQNDELYIVDSYSSGHFINFIATPAKILESNVRGKIKNLLGGMIEFLVDRDQSGVVVCALPQKLVTTETKDLVDQLVKLGVKPAGLVVNRAVTCPIAPESGISAAVLAEWEQFKNSNAKQLDGLRDCAADVSMPIFFGLDAGFVNRPFDDLFYLNYFQRGY